jgi:hypothetical protein
MATRSISRRGLRSDDNTPDRRERKRVQGKKKHEGVTGKGGGKLAKADPAADQGVTSGTLRAVIDVKDWKVAGAKKGSRPVKGPSLLPRWPPARLIGELHLTHSVEPGTASAGKRPKAMSTPLVLAVDVHVTDWTPSSKKKGKESLPAEPKLLPRWPPTR